MGDPDLDLDGKFVNSTKWDRLLWDTIIDNESVLKSARFPKPSSISSNLERAGHIQSHRRKRRSDLQGQDQDQRTFQFRPGQALDQARHQTAARESPGQDRQAQILSGHCRLKRSRQADGQDGELFLHRRIRNGERLDTQVQQASDPYGSGHQRLEGLPSTNRPRAPAQPGGCTSTSTSISAPGRC